MSMYRVDRLPGGSYVRYPTTVENEAAGAIVNGAATGAAAVAGWLVGSSITGMRSLARNFQDRRMQAAAEAMETAATAEQFDRLVGLAKDFGSHYPGQLLGEFYLAVALNGTGRYDEAITVADRAIGLGLDETEARGLRLEAYEGKGSIPGLLEEWSALIHHQDSLVRNTALLARARVLESIGDFDQALDDANRSISGLPDHVAYHVRGHIYESKGELEKAIDDYSR